MFVSYIFSQIIHFHFIEIINALNLKKNYIYVVYIIEVQKEMLTNWGTFGVPLISQCT